MGVRLLLATLMICSTAESAFEQTVRGARATGLGGAAVAVEGDVWASYTNPACLPNSSETCIGVEFSPALYGIGELKRGAISITGGLPTGMCALSISGFGFELYRELSVGVAWAHALTEHVVLGIGVNLYSLAIHQYGNDRTVGLDVGMLVQVTPAISYGVSFRNANRPSIGSDREPLPQTMGMGVGVRPFPDALVALSAEKDSHYPFELCIGMEYVLEHLVTVRLGAVNEPSSISAGIGVHLSTLRVDYAYKVHPDLGGTHCFSLSFPLPWP
jgi:hypothetical protein